MSVSCVRTRANKLEMVLGSGSWENVTGVTAMLGVRFMKKKKNPTQALPIEFCFLARASSRKKLMTSLPSQFWEMRAPDLTH